MKARTMIQNISVPGYPNASLTEDNDFFYIDLKTGLGAGVYPKSDYNIDQAIEDQLKIFKES